MKTSSFNRIYIHLMLIIMLGLFAYSNTFHVPFQFDDKFVIEKNPIIKDLRYFVEPSKAEAFKGHFQYKTFRSRYIGYLTFALNYRIHGLDVTGYHIVNLIIHISTALLVYLLVLLSFQSPLLITSRIKDSSGYIAVFTAIVFAVHPIQTQAITYIWQRVASLATLLYLLSLVMYIKARLSSTRASTLGFHAVSLISAVCAMKTKEIAFMLPVMIVLYEFLFFEGKIKKRVFFLIPLVLTMLIVPLTLIDINRPIGELIGDVSEETRGASELSRKEYLVTSLRVIVTYIRLLFLPVKQNLDYDYPIYQSFFHPEVMVSFLFLLFIVGVSGYVFRRYRDTAPHIRLIFFGILWFFINLILESSIIPLNNVIFEHRMYLPSIGMFIAVSTCLFLAGEHLRVRWNSIQMTMAVSLTVIVLVLSGATYARNIVWKNAISLWGDVVSKSPENDRAHNNLGVAYQAQELLDKALVHFRIALKLKPDYSDAYYNIGVTYQSQGLADKAIEQYQITIQLYPDYVEAHNNLGNIYKSQGLFDKAVEQYLIAQKINPDFPETYNNLGIVYNSKGLFDEAVKNFQIAIQLNPELSEAHNNLGIAYGTKGIIDKAVEQYQIAVRINPEYSEAHYNLGVAYRTKGIIDKAVEHYQTAIQHNPEFLEARYNLADIYYTLGLFDNAIENYKEVSKLKTEWEKPHFKLGLIYLKKGEKRKARREFEKVLKIYPNHHEARKLLNSVIQKNDLQ